VRCLHIFSILSLTLNAVVAAIAAARARRVFMAAKPNPDIDADGAKKLQIMQVHSLVVEGMELKGDDDLERSDKSTSGARTCLKSP
jgi:hypothetical protein